MESLIFSASRWSERGVHKTYLNRETVILVAVLEVLNITALGLNSQIPALR